MITSSLDWADTEAALIKKSAGLKYNREIVRMIRNIEKDIKDLSNAEVMERRGYRQNKERILKNVNENIEIIEEFMVVAKLLG